jgi:hypothetical protein
LDDANTVDWHINIGPGRTSDEFHGIVAEVTPKHRIPNLTLDDLVAMAQRRQRIKITGQLMLDNVHKIRRRRDENNHANPARFSIWEIHPVRAVKGCLPSGPC